MLGQNTRGVTVASHLSNNSSCYDHYTHDLLCYYSLRALTLATLKGSTRWTLATKQALNSSYTKELNTTSLRVCKWVSKVIIPPRRGVNQSQVTRWILNQSPGEYQRARDNQFFSRGSRACRHASPRCVDQHLVVWQLRGVAWISSIQLDTTRTYPQVR